jgi:hypothetical protein
MLNNNLYKIIIIKCNIFDIPNFMRTCHPIYDLTNEMIKDENSILFRKKIYLQGVVVYKLGYMLAKKHNYHDLMNYFITKF